MGIIARAESAFTMNAFTLNLKYCPDCNITRSPRSAHCYICNHCVEKFDHHCPWIGVCVGKKSYFWFILYIFVKAVFLWFIGSCCVYAVVKAAKFEISSSSNGFRIWLIVFFILIGLTALAFAVFVSLLLGFHLFLIYTNETTKEYLKKTNEGLPGNPFSASITRTLKKFCTSRKKKTFLNRKIVQPKIVESTEREGLVELPGKYVFDTTITQPNASMPPLKVEDFPETRKSSL